MPTARATNIQITNLSNTPSSYRTRLVVQRLDQDFTPYPDLLFTPWSSETGILLMGQTSGFIPMEILPFNLQNGHYAQVRVQVALVSPTIKDDLLFSSWAPAPPYRMVAVTGVQLFAGENVVVYNGPVQSVPEAFDSLSPYLFNSFVVAQILGTDGVWYNTTTFDTMVPGATYRITVSADALWTW